MRFPPWTDEEAWWAKQQFEMEVKKSAKKKVGNHARWPARGLHRGSIEARNKWDGRVGRHGTILF